MSNPFNDRLDWAIQGKYVRAYGNNAVYEGWCEMMHHNKNSLILHDAEEINRGKDVGSVFIRMCDTVEVLKPSKNIEWVALDDLEPYPGYDLDFEPDEDVVRRCSRNRSAGAYPVVTAEEGLIINGHKRVEAAKAAGLDRHAVEVIDVTPKQAQELFEMAHPDATLTEGQSDSSTAGTNGRRLGSPATGYHQSRSR